MNTTELDNAPKFCSRCGDRTIQKKECSGFDTQTGEKRYDTVVKCPRTLHMRVVYDHDGNQYYDIP